MVGSLALVLAAALFNPRLCKLLPWTSQARPDVEAQILKIFLLPRCAEMINTTDPFDEIWMSKRVRAVTEYYTLQVKPHLEPEWCPIPSLSSPLHVSRLGRLKNDLN